MEKFIDFVFLNFIIIYQLFCVAIILNILFVDYFILGIKNKKLITGSFAIIIAILLGIIF